MALSSLTSQLEDVQAETLLYATAPATKDATAPATKGTSTRSLPRPEMHSTCNFHYIL